MMKSAARYIALMLAILVFAACSSQRNTSNIRWWKGFKTRYNTYFNGHQAYLEGMKAKIEGNKDNYTKTIPLLMVGNKPSQKLGSGQFETTVTKCEKAIQLYSIKTKPEVKRGHKMTPEEKAFRNRKEFNPFMKNVWILMGKAQMEKGEFLEAAATFSYVERLYRDQPQVANVARSLQALCYTEQNWFYDAEDILRKVKRDSIPRASRRVYNTAVTNYHLRQKDWKKALPYLVQEVKNMPRGIPKARGYFLQGQVYKELGQKPEAYQSFKKCMNQSPPFEMRVSAQVLQTEVMPEGTGQKRVKKLKRMARRAINKDYLDQIYYAMGNIYLADHDTLKAIEAYEKGGKESLKSTNARNALMLKLGDIYWGREEFEKAHKCYAAAISSVEKENERYEELQIRNKVLTQLVPPTKEIFIQDSLQGMVRMSEAERNAIIDKVIEHAKLIEKMKKRERADSIRKARAKGGGGSKGSNTNINNSNTKNGGKADASKSTLDQGGGVWYFYNDQALMDGKEQFTKQWGNRQNEDNWRRNNKETTAPQGGTSDTDNDNVANGGGTSSDSTGTGVVKEAGKKKRKKSKEEQDSITEGPLSRKYYLDQLPMTDEKMAESNKKLSEALFTAGVIEKDQLDNYPLCKKTLERLYTEFPDFEKMEDLLYHLFLMELHWGTREKADEYRKLLAEKYPEGQYTETIMAPDFEENAKYGKQIEDSLYADAYMAFRNNDFETLKRDCKISEKKYLKGENRGKFKFLHAMYKLHNNDIKGFTQELRELIKLYGKDPISEVASSIIKGIESGKVPQGNFKLSDLWESRNDAATNQADSLLLQDSLHVDKLSNHILILAYRNDSVNEGQLLYEVSRFNFTNFDVRSFDIELLSSQGDCQMHIKNFNSFDEVHRYEQDLFQDSACQVVLENVHPIIISEHNLKLIGVKYTLEDYLQFYQDNYIPSKVKDDLKIDQQPDNFIWDEFQETPDNEEEENSSEEEEEIEEDGGEWY